MKFYNFSVKKTVLNAAMLPTYVLLLASLSVPVQAEIYKWVDVDGSVQYSQTPPPEGITAETIKPPPSVDNSAAEQALNDRLDGINSRADKRRKNKDEQRLAEKDKQAQQIECDKAQKRKQNYSYPRVSAVAKDGTHTRLSEEQRQATLKQINDYIAEHCN